MATTKSDMLNCDQPPSYDEVLSEIFPKNPGNLSMVYQYPASNSNNSPIGEGNRKRWKSTPLLIIANIFGMFLVSFGVLIIVLAILLLIYYYYSDGSGSF